MAITVEHENTYKNVISRVGIIFFLNRKRGFEFCGCSVVEEKKIKSSKGLDSANYY